MTMSEALQRLKMSWSGKRISLRCVLAHNPDMISLPVDSVTFEATISRSNPYEYIGSWSADNLEELCVAACGAELKGGLRADEATAGIATCEQA